jgi:hypothetical protein
LLDAENYFLGKIYSQFGIRRSKIARSQFFEFLDAARSVMKTCHNVWWLSRRGNRPSSRMTWVMSATAPPGPRAGYEFKTAIHASACRSVSRRSSKNVVDKGGHPRAVAVARLFPELPGPSSNLGRLCRNFGIAKLIQRGLSLIASA